MSGLHLSKIAMMYKLTLHLCQCSFPQSLFFLDIQQCESFSQNCTDILSERGFLLWSWSEMEVDRGFKVKDALLGRFEESVEKAW